MVNRLDPADNCFPVVNGKEALDGYLCLLTKGFEHTEAQSGIADIDSHSPMDPGAAPGTYLIFNGARKMISQMPPLFGITARHPFPHPISFNTLYRIYILLS